MQFSSFVYIFLHTLQDVYLYCAVRETDAEEL